MPERPAPPRRGRPRESIYVVVAVGELHRGATPWRKVAAAMEVVDGVMWDDGGEVEARTFAAAPPPCRRL